MEMDEDIWEIECDTSPCLDTWRIIHIPTGMEVSKLDVGRDGSVDFVWTHKDFRRMGLATELLRQARAVRKVCHDKSVYCGILGLLWVLGTGGDALSTVEEYREELATLKQKEGIDQ